MQTVICFHVQFQGVCFIGSTVWMVMEYCDGGAQLSVTSPKMFFFIGFA
jgi:hypothetical protein